MKIYKYRDLSNPDEETLKRLYQLIINNLVWCACPDQLNDKDEFLFEIDYAPTESTAHLLSQILAHDKTISPEDALSLASHYIMNNKLEHIASPIMKSMMENCRNSLGVACFSISKDNAVMWERYGGNGNGICIEIDVPDNLIDKTLFRVTYVSKKTFHVDSIFKSVLPNNNAWDSYRNILLTKIEVPWKSEEEVRIITKKQNVAMRIDGSTITEVVFGNKVESQVVDKIMAKIKQN